MPLRNGVLTVTMSVLAVLPGLSLAQKAADDPAARNEGQKLNVTIGLKVWGNRWDTWDNPQEAETAKTKASFIPSIGLNYGRFFGSFGYFARTKYNFPTLGDTSRTEYDINVGYWMVQSETGRLGLTVGYKHAKQDFQDTPEIIKAPTIGITGGARIGGAWTLYGNAAIGRATETSSNGFDSTGAILPGVGFRMRGTYTSVEAGVAYAIAPNTAVTAGYKVQVVDVGGSDCDVSRIGNRCRDTTNGFIVGISHTF
jgi:hypothetical protein